MAGILAMMLVVWVTNGLRQSEPTTRPRPRRRSSAPAGQKWKTQVESEVGKVGTISPGAPPAVFPDLATTIAALQKGKVPTAPRRRSTTTAGGCEVRGREPRGVRPRGYDPRQGMRGSGLAVPELAGAIVQGLAAVRAGSRPRGPRDGRAGRQRRRSPTRRGHPGRRPIVAPGRLEQVPERAESVRSRSPLPSLTGPAGARSWSVIAPGSVVVLANPTAGHGKAGRLIGRVNAIVEQLGVDHEIRVSRSAEDLEQLATRPAKGRRRRGARRRRQRRPRRERPRGHRRGPRRLPSGTADDFATSIGVGKLDTAIRALADPKTVEIDLAASRRRGAPPTSTWPVRLRLGGERGAANAMRRRLGASGTTRRDREDPLAVLPASFQIELDEDGRSGRRDAGHRRELDRYGGGMKVLPARVDRGRMARRLPREHEQGSVPPRVPQGVPRHPRLASERDDAARPACGSRPIAASWCTPTVSGSARPGRLRGAAGGAARGRRPEREGGAMTDGLLLIHAFPLDARMWEPQMDRRTVVAPICPGSGEPGGGRRAHDGGGRGDAWRRWTRPAWIASSSAVSPWAGTWRSTSGAGPPNGSPDWSWRTPGPARTHRRRRRSSGAGRAADGRG